MLCKKEKKALVSNAKRKMSMKLQQWSDLGLRTRLS